MCEYHRQATVAFGELLKIYNIMFSIKMKGTLLSMKSALQSFLNCEAYDNNKIN